MSERGVLLRPEANELRTGFADHTQTEEGTEQVQPRDQEVTKKRIINLKQERQNGKRHGKIGTAKRRQTGTNREAKRKVYGTERGRADDGNPRDDKGRTKTEQKRKAEDTKAKRKRSPRNINKCPNGC